MIYWNDMETADMIKDILFDRSKKEHFIFYEADGIENIRSQAASLALAVSSLSEKDRLDAEKNIAVLRQTCGHAGRTARNSASGALLSLVRWSESAEIEKDISPLLADAKNAEAALEEIARKSMPDESDAHASFPDLCRKAERLKVMPGANSAIARAHAINSILERFLKPENYAKGKPPISLDTNGILIELRGFHSHLPYGLLSEESMRAIRDSRASAEEAASEIEVRHAYESSSFEKYVTLSESQARGSFPTDRELRECFSPPFDYGKIFSKISEAEDICLKFAEETLEGSEKKKPLEGYFSINDEYEVRKKILNHPGIYGALKIIIALVESGAKPSAKDRFMPIFSPFKKGKNAEEFAFIETAFGEKSARFLIDSGKHLSPLHREKLSAWPTLPRETYADISFIFEHLSYYSECLSDIADAKDIPAEAAEYVLHFVLANMSKSYPELERAGYDKERFLKAAEAAKEAYLEKLYASMAAGALFEEAPEKGIRRFDIRFDEAFLAHAKKGLESFAFNPKLFLHGFESRAVAIDHAIKDISETVPFNIEESALDALRLHRGRPLINVVGGCKHLGPERGNPMDEIAKAVVRAGHSAKANIAVPGTQSGLGVSFAEENIHYRMHFADLSHHDKAHMFSVTPGGNALFPGTPFSGMQPKEECYALAPVDAILTPLGADWDAADAKIHDSRYFTHIAYMESLYRRLSRGAKHVIVAGNGGLFTLAEIDRLLPCGFDIVLIEESGRFAEIAGMLFGKISEETLSSAERFESFVREFLAERSEKEAIAEFFSKDFGLSDSQSRKQALYREKFRDFFLKTAKNPQSVRTCKIEKLEETLANLLK